MLFIRHNIQLQRVFENEYGEIALSHYKMMLDLLTDFEQQILNDWNQKIIGKLPELLSKNLLQRKGQLLADNFDPEVYFILFIQFNQQQYI